MRVGGMSGGIGVSDSAELQLDEEHHVYSLGGRIIPSVTQILENVGIVDYSMLPDSKRVMALDRGRFVHQICQFDDERELGAFDARLQPYLDAWRRFRDLYRFVPTMIEHRGYCQKYGYAGTLDRRGLMGDQSDVLLDIKTSVAPYWTAFQTAAYANFFENPASCRRMAVALRDDGTPKVHEYRCAEYMRHLNVFLAALTVFNAKEGR